MRLAAWPGHGVELALLEVDHEVGREKGAAGGPAAVREREHADGLSLTLALSPWERGERFGEQSQRLVASSAGERGEQVGPAETVRLRPGVSEGRLGEPSAEEPEIDVLGLTLGDCLLYTSDAADDLLC